MDRIGKFKSLSAEEPAYHGLKFHDTFGPYAFIIYSIAVSLRDLGMTMAPQNAFQTLLGLETLFKNEKACEQCT